MNIENENEEDVVADVVEESTEETTEETTEHEGTVAEKKPQETLEARKSRLERQLAQTYKKMGIETEYQDVKTPPSKKSDDFGYDIKAYLKTSGITETEFDFVKKELKSSGIKDVDTLLANGYFKSNLETFRALNKTAEATPTGKRSNGVSADSVDYWVAKAGPNAENLEDVPKDMRAKVVSALESKDKNKGKFYNS